MNFEAFANLNFPSGHFISEIVGVEGKMLDPIGRPALAKAIIEGKRITIQSLLLSRWMNHRNPSWS
jgi:hypothetical protein